MLRAFKVVPPSASDRAPCRRQRRCIPSLRESASSLEDRVLLSVAGHGAPAADVARPLAETAAGQHVTALFESILHTDPTSQQLTHWVHALRSGVGANALRKDLTAEAGRGSSPPASVPMTVVMGGSPSASVAETSTGRSGMAAILANQTNSTAASQGLNVRQIPAGMSLSVSLSPGATPAVGEGTMTTTVNSGSATGMTSTGTMSSGGTMTSTGMMSSGGTMTSTGMMSSGSSMTSTGMMISSVTITSASSPTTGVTNMATIGTPTPLPFSPLPFSPIIVTPV